MKADIINPFVTGAVSVLRQLLPGTEIKQGELAIHAKYEFAGDVLTIIKYYGDMEGLIVFDLKEETSIKIAEIMNYTVFNNYNDMVKATVKEMANMISGKAISYLRENGIHFDISTPEQMKVDAFTAPDRVSKILTIPIETKAGLVTINVSLFS